MRSSPFRRALPVFLSLSCSLVSTQAETLEALLAPVVDAEVKRVAALPPTGDPWERSDFLVYAASSSEGGPNNPEVLVTSATFLAEDPADTRMLVERADAWRQLAQFSRALAEIDRVPAADAGTAEVQFLRAQVLQAQGRLPGALAAAKAVAGDNDYYREKAAEIAATLEAQRAAWEKSLRPLLAAPPANPEPAFARAALDGGATNLAHDLARRVLATRPDDATAREVLLAIYARLEPDTPALTRAVHTAGAPLAAAQARAHPTNPEAWNQAVQYAATLVPDAGPAGAAAFATLLRDAKAAGANYPVEEVLLALCTAPDAAAVRQLRDAHFGLMAENGPLQAVANRRLLDLSPVRPALDAARAEPARAERWNQLLALARPEIESGRLPGSLYGDFLAQAAAAGQTFHAEQARAKLYAADTNYDIVQAIRAALPETRTQPDLEVTIAAVARRFTDIPPASLGFNTALAVPPGVTPLFTEDLMLSPETRAGLLGLKHGLVRARIALQLGAPGEALAELGRADPDEAATPELWLLRTRLLLLNGRPQEALLALDRARFLAGQPFDLPEDERIDGVATATLRQEILSACQQAAENIPDLEDRLARLPDEADSWGRLARVWSEGRLACVPKALAAAARARQLDPRQPDALRAELNALGAQLGLMAADLGGPVAALLVNRLDQFTDNDWLLRAQLLRSLPHDTRKTLAAQWLDQLRPKRDRIPDGALIELSLRIYGIQQHSDVEDILARFGELPEDHPLQFEYQTAQQVDEAFLRQRGWFFGEPEGLWEEEIDERNLVAAIQQGVLRRAREALLPPGGATDDRDLAKLQAELWEDYERLRVASHAGILRPKDWTGTSDEFRAKVIATGRFGPATATAEPTAGCVPYFPGLTTAERQLATDCIALLLETSVRLDHARLTTLALSLYRRQQIRDRDLAAWQPRVADVSGGGDLAEDPALDRALDLANAQRYAEAADLIRPLLARGMVNYYLETIAGVIANSERRHTDGMRHYARAKSYVSAIPSMVKYVDECVAVVSRNLAADRSHRRAAIQARLAYLDEFLGYLLRDAQNSAAMAKNAVSGMEDLRQSEMTYYNADSLQHQANKYGLMHDNAKSRLQEIVQQAEELEAERTKLREELRRL